MGHSLGGRKVIHRWPSQEFEYKGRTIGRVADAMRAVEYVKALTEQKGVPGGTVLSTLVALRSTACETAMRVLPKTNQKKPKLSAW